MASFDKKTAATGAGNKKNIIAGVLAAVLALVVVHHFTKTAPSEAAVDNGGAPAAGIVPASETPAAVKAALDSEFSRQLKPQTVEGPSAIDTPPSDPFQLSSTWRDKLIRPVVWSDPVGPVVLPHTNSGDNTGKPSLPAWNPSSLKLTGIFKGSVHTYAVINGSIITEGMIVGGARVVEIVDDHVTLQQLGAPDSARVDLMIQRPGMK